jgi:hypothetical protein
MSNPIVYNPNPTRVWSRVQNQCTYIQENDSYDSVYIPLLNKKGTLLDASLIQKQIQKGNILQYKNNNFGMTKNQRYSLIAKGMWNTRKKGYATQSQTYTNPNTNSYQRVNYNSIPFPNEIVGSPNNISGPFQYYSQRIGDCSNNLLKDGGSLIGTSIVNQCTGEVINTFKQRNLFPTYCSDVPGTPIYLYWDSKLSPWYPKTRYFMNNSTNKYPINYKGFVSAVKPDPPIVSIESETEINVTITWINIESKECLPISSFNIYLNGVIYINVPYTTFTVTINITSNENIIYVTSLSTTIESTPSNTIIYNL